jgi:hypothetical protein
MAATIQSVLSKVQRTIGDEGFLRIKRAELIDIIDDAIKKVADTTRMWIEQVEIAPRNVTETFTVNTANDLTSLTPVALDTAFVLDRGLRYRFYNNAWEIHPYNTVKIDPGTTIIHKTLQVWKNGIQCNEQSLQSINQGYATGLFYTGTNVAEPNALGNEYAQIRRPDDGSTFIFSRDFESSDIVTIIYLKERPYIPVLWTTSISLPDPVKAAIEWETIAQCQNIMYLQGNDNALGRVQFATKQAEDELKSADAYLRNLLNENSSITIQPLRWLAE